MITTPRPGEWRVVRAFQDNGPDYWLIFEGNKTFGADPIARCDQQERAEQIVREHNAHDKLVEALKKALDNLEHKNKIERKRVYGNSWTVADENTLEFLKAALALAKEGKP